ncbi:hypothetical protein ZEAMMB73_Zm00001d020202 [Zea mays]|uniref:Uncharacterized protein n=1 Tax=Zea mays TaxID=4577 RepID=A0A1D6I2S1_MAIZE|nr:hypothetical protein ZEAMMB73_Zm00001d020202 [Zea mays]
MACTSDQRDLPQGYALEVSLASFSLRYDLEKEILILNIDSLLFFESVPARLVRDSSSFENQLAFLRCKGSQQRVGYTKGWENYDIEHIPIPSGYAEWGTIILAKHSFNLRGDGEVDGEFYEEYVPSHHEREPSMLLYPKCLSQLLEVWDELQVGGRSIAARMV